MEDDDLPPKKGAPQEETGADAFGNMIGALIWVALFAVIAGGVVYGLMRWMP
jgi:hypothetical protein